jgi:antibiotic biosynthesis monooxygenase (ABM) superfamily enzyme
MIGDTAQTDQDTVTVVVTRVVHPGKDKQFAAWADDIDRAVTAFAGHQGGVRLYDEQGLNHLVYQFDSAENLRAWEASDARRELIRRGDQISDEQRSTTGGRNAWFTVPSSSASPRWKTFLITWAAVYPTLLIIATVIGRLAPGLAQPAALAINSAMLTALLTWLLLPRVTHRTRTWLLSGARPTPAPRPRF